MTQEDFVEIMQKYGMITSEWTTNQYQSRIYKLGQYQISIVNSATSKDSQIWYFAFGDETSPVARFNNFERYKQYIDFSALEIYKTQLGKALYDS